MKAFSVLSLNLRFGLADDGPNGWEHRKKAVLRLFREARSDFIATQEANEFQVDFLARNLTEYDYIGKRVPAPWFWQHNILFFRKPIVCEEEALFFLSETPNIPSRSFGSRFPRQGTLGRFSVDGRPLVCINTHFDFDTPAQMGAVRVIRNQLSYFQRNTPAILMGDFNATPESPCYRWLTADAEDDEKGLAFQETFTEPYPGTFHRFTGERVAGYIDWILCRGPIRLKHCRVLQASEDGTYVSDHFPVHAVFEI